MRIKIKSNQSIIIALMKKVIVITYFTITLMTLMNTQPTQVQALSPQYTEFNNQEDNQMIQEQYQDYQGQQDFQFSNQQEQYLNQFATAMSDFFPQQTFYFNLSQQQQQTFIFWPTQKIKELRGLFYIAQGVDSISAQDQSNNDVRTGLYLACISDNKIQKEFNNKRLGVFQIPFTRGHMKLQFKSDLQNLTVYLSYQLKQGKQQKVNYSQNQEKNEAPSKQATPGSSQPKKDQLSQSQMKTIFKRFQRIDLQLEGQQILIKNMNHFTMNQYQKMQQQFYWGKVRIVIETLLVVISGSVCLFLLYKKLEKGYELLV